jgi:hypothetical protein
MKLLTIIFTLLLLAGVASAQVTTNGFQSSTFANLGSKPSGRVFYCTDCNEGNPATGGGSGAYVYRIGGIWVGNKMIPGGGSGGAPTNATYITQIPNASLSNEQALSLLPNGIMRVAASTGVVTVINTSDGLRTNLTDPTGTSSAVFSAGPLFNTHINILTSAAPSVSVGAQSRIYMDSLTNQLKVSVHGGAYKNFLVGDSSFTLGQIPKATDFTSFTPSSMDDNGSRVRVQSNLTVTGSVNAPTVTVPVTSSSANVVRLTTVADGQLLFRGASATFDRLIFASSGGPFMSVDTKFRFSQTITSDADVEVNAKLILGSGISRIYAPTLDGGLVFTNAALNDFTLLRFGGETASYPALRRNGTGLQVRLADDSNGGGFTAATYATTTNCADSAGAAACGSAAAGHFVVDASSTSAVVSTTAVTSTSEITLTVDSSLGALLGVTCNTQSSLVLGTPRVTARTAGVSFTVAVDVAPTTSRLCLNYKIVN